MKRKSGRVIPSWSNGRLYITVPLPVEDNSSEDSLGNALGKNGSWPVRQRNMSNSNSTGKCSKKSNSREKLSDDTDLLDGFLLGCVILTIFVIFFAIGIGISKFMTLVGYFMINFMTLIGYTMKNIMYYCCYAYILYLFREILYFLARCAFGFFQSMYKLVSSVDGTTYELLLMNVALFLQVLEHSYERTAFIILIGICAYILYRMTMWTCGLIQSIYKFLFSPDVIAKGCALLMVAIVISSLDFYNKWTWFTLAFIVFIGICIHKLYCNAKESHASILTRLQNSWSSVKSYFHKKDAYVDSILSTTTQILVTTQLIFDEIPETQQNLRETIKEVGNFSKLLIKYTQKVGDETTDCIGEFKQQMITSSENLNRLFGELRNTSKIAGSAIETAEGQMITSSENLNRLFGELRNTSKIAGSAIETAEGQMITSSENLNRLFCELKNTAQIKGVMLEREQNRLNRDALVNRICAVTKAITYAGASFCLYDVHGLIGVLKMYTESFMQRATRGIDEGIQSVNRGIDGGLQIASRGVDDLTQSVTRGVDDLTQIANRGVDDLTQSVNRGIDEGMQIANRGVDDLTQSVNRGVDDLTQSVTRGIDAGKFQPHVEVDAPILPKVKWPKSFTEHPPK
ncbi:hypothetical protein Ddc_21140 [Ditylenchus destructor]|nr:hypothetical protein Ddc_21140 [Ditylenchus destructor]